MLRDRLGLRRVKSAATGGSALGPDTFRFFLAMGVPLRQLYGQTEAAGAYTIQTGSELDFDSSGLPFEDTEVQIHRPDGTGLGEIRVRHPGMFKGYFKQPDETRKAMTEDGWLATGDAGYLDERGRLVVVDRVKDIATTSTGVRFSPQFIENKLKFSPYIGECVVLGNGRPAVTAILCLRHSMVAKWAEAQGLAFTSYTNLAARPEIYQLLAREVEKVNASLPPAQRISPVPAPLQGAGCRRRRAHPDPQAAPRRDRRALPGPDRRALLGPAGRSRSRPRSPSKTVAPGRSPPR